MNDPVLITLEEVKALFPRWAEFCTPIGAVTADEVLHTAVLLAESELLELVRHVPVPTPEAIRRHLIVLVRKAAFDHMHGQATFESKPQVIRDYERSIEMLERYTPGGLGEAEGSFVIHSKARRFHEWFQRD